MTPQQARAAFRALLAGDLPNGTEPATLGPWGEPYAALLEAHTQGGTEAVRRAWIVLERANPSLSTLIGADPEPTKVWYSQADIYSMEVPDLVWIVPDLLHAGLTILSGQGKIGKSWLALQLAHAVAMGGRVFDRQVTQRKVAYLAFEDGWRRIKARGLKQGIPAEAGIFYADTQQVPLLNTTEGVQFVIDALDDYELVIIDTLGRALDVKDRNNYAEMTGAVAPIQQAAQAMNRAVLCLDHHGKLTTLTRQGTPNPVLDILGSVGLGGVVDCALGLYKQHSEPDLILASSGKEAEPVSWVLHWDPLTVCWHLVGNVEQVAKNNSERAVLDAIQQLAEDMTIPSTAAIAEHLGKDRGYVSRVLSELTTAGKVRKGEHIGKEVPYLLPGMAIDLLK